VQAANAVALGIALDDPHGEELFAAFADLPDRAFGDGDEWPEFVRQLATLRAGRRPAVTPRLGAYFTVLSLWSSESGTFARALQSVLDHHLEQVRTRGKRRGDFEDPWVALFPLEVLAVKRTRQSLGLPMPKVEHPLMFTHFATMPPAPAWPTEPLLQRLEREHRRR
jgi:hypothetical protein